MAVLVHFNTRRCQPLRKPYAFFERFMHFFMIQGVGRAVDQALAIGDSRAAPRLQQFNDARFSLLRHGTHALGTYCARMREEFIGDDALFLVPRQARRHFPVLARHCFVTTEKFFDLQRIVRKRLGRGINCRQATADHHHRQPQLHICNGVGFSRPGKLQSHQKIRRGAHAARETVGHIEHRRSPSADRQCDMIEAHGKGFIRSDRTAESHAAEKRELLAALQQ